MYRFILLGLSLIHTLGPASAYDAAEAKALQKATVIVEMVDIQDLRGSLRVALFTSKEHYDLKETELAETAQVLAESAKVEFRGIPAGDVLVLLYHDLNNNGKLDTNFLGIPKEPYASSIGRRGRLGPPTWSKGAVPVAAGDNVLRISLK